MIEDSKKRTSSRFASFLSRREKEMDSRTVGVLGGGQLGRMMVEAAHRLGVNVVCIDPGGDASPAAQCGAKTFKGHFNNGADIKAFVKVRQPQSTTMFEHSCQTGIGG